MSMTRSLLLVACLSLAAVSPAQALKLTNRDPSDQKITVQENNGSREQVVKPSESVEAFCTAGCTIKMQNGEEYEFDGNEIVSIEEGLIFLDEPAAQGSGETRKQ